MPLICISNILNYYIFKYLVFVFVSHAHGGQVSPADNVNKLLIQSYCRQCIRQCVNVHSFQGVPAEPKNDRHKPEYSPAKREHLETERSLAIEKHRMNIAQLENEKRKAVMAGKTDARPESVEHERSRPRSREELRRSWELDNRKRKLEQSEVEPLSSFANKAEELAALRKEQYLAMHSREHEVYAIPGMVYTDRVPYPDRARSAGNPPFYLGRQAEVSVTEALRKQREFNERQENIRKIVNHEQSMVDSVEPAKKKMRNSRCMCGVCGKEASFLCSGCQKAWYCSAKCQVST